MAEPGEGKSDEICCARVAERAGKVERRNFLPKTRLGVEDNFTDTGAMIEVEPYFTHDPDRAAQSLLMFFIEFCEIETGGRFPDFVSFHAFSVERARAFHHPRRYPGDLHYSPNPQISFALQPPSIGGGVPAAGGVLSDLL
jgi:hypothetical protein